MVLDKAMEWRKLSFVFTNSTLHTLGCIFTQILSHLYIAVHYKSTLHIMQILLMNRHSHHLQGFSTLYWIEPECSGMSTLHIYWVELKMCLYYTDLLFLQHKLTLSHHQASSGLALYLALHFQPLQVKLQPKAQQTHQSLQSANQLHILNIARVLHKKWNYVNVEQTQNL